MVVVREPQVARRKHAKSITPADFSVSEPRRQRVKRGPFMSRDVSPPPTNDFKATASAGEELRALMKLALPLGLAQAGQALMGVVDTAVVGRLDATAQGGVGLGNGLFFGVSTFGCGVMFALDPLISQAVGARQPGEARHWYWQGMWISVLLALALMGPMAVTPLFLPAFGVDPEVVRVAEVYLWARLPNLFFLFFFIAARGYLQGVGRPRAIFWAMVLANIANFGLDVLLVYGAGPVPALGPLGAAIATDLCAALQWLMLLWPMRAPSPEVSRRPDFTQLSKLFRLGLPIGLQLTAEVGVFVLAGVLAGRLGKIPLAAHMIALQWSSFSFSLAVGIGNAAGTRVGWAVGANDTASARRSGLVGFGAGIGVMLGSAAVFLLVPGLLAGLMSKESEVISLTVTLFGVAAFFQVSDGLQAIGSGALRGLGETRFASIANVVAHWAIGLPIAIGLGFFAGKGIEGIWWGLSAGLTAVAIALVARFVRRTRSTVAAL